MRYLFLGLALASSVANAAPPDEMIIGDETVGAGINVIFEGAIKDEVTPLAQNLAEAKTDVHIEARVNWSSDAAIDVPPGATRGGFVPYLQINAVVMNERTGESVHVSLIPHVNLVDNFHYARNMALPGKRSDRYRAEFFVDPPEAFSLAYHRGWTERYGGRLFEPARFVYADLDFEAIAKASRR